MTNMLLPSQLAAMKLGCKRIPKKFFGHDTNAFATKMSVLPAWERIMETNRVEGNNSVIGDCVPTGACNVVQTLLSRQNNFTAIPNILAEQIYAAVTGWNANDPSSDKGTDINQFFTWWEDNAIAGFKLQSVAEINPLAENQIKSIIQNKGYILTVMALATQQQNEKLWLGDGTPGSWGYHCGCYDGFDGPTYNLTTWGLWQPVDRSFFNSGFVVGVFDLNLVAA